MQEDWVPEVGIELLSRRAVLLFFMKFKLDLLFSTLCGPNNLGSVLPSYLYWELALNQKWTELLWSGLKWKYNWFKSQVFYSDVDLKSKLRYLAQ